MNFFLSFEYPLVAIVLASSFPFLFTSIFFKKLNKKTRKITVLQPEAILTHTEVSSSSIIFVLYVNSYSYWYHGTI